MSLDVPTALLERAETGDVDDAAFVDVVRHSLPYAWQVVTGVVGRLEEGVTEYADDSTPPTDEERGQLMRAFASDAIRGGLERHFGVRLAFQNCHKVAAFRRSAVGEAAYTVFVSPRSQLLNQSPQLRHC